MSEEKSSPLQKPVAMKSGPGIQEVALAMLLYVVCRSASAATVDLGVALSAPPGPISVRSNIVYTGSKMVRIED